MDTVGAVIGPLCATALLSVLGVRGVLVWSALPGLLAAVAFAWLAPGADSAAGHHAPSFVSSFGQMPRSYWHYLAGVFAHGIGDFAPTLLILRANQILTPPLGPARAATVSVALYTFHNIINAAASYPAGAWGDRLGKRGLLAVGYLVGFFAYAAFIIRAADDSRAGGAIWAGGNPWGSSAIARKNRRLPELLPAENRGAGVWSAGDRQWHWRSRIECGGGRAMVGGESGGGICLRGGVCVSGFGADLRLAMSGGRALRGALVEAAAGSAGRNGCCGRRRWPGRPGWRTGSISGPGVDRRGGAAEIRRGYLGNRRNRKSRNLSGESPLSGLFECSGTACGVRLPGAWSRAAPDESARTKGLSSA